MQRPGKGSEHAHHDDEPVEPMTPEHFEITVASMKLQSQATIEAARSVLVEGLKHKEASARYGVTQSQISRATSRIEKKWQEICEREDWLYEPIALPKEMMELVRALQSTTMAPLKKRLESRKSRNARKKIQDS